MSYQSLSVSQALHSRLKSETEKRGLKITFIIDSLVSEWLESCEKQNQTGGLTASESSETVA